MMTNTCLGLLLPVQALVWCLTGCFACNNNSEKHQVTQARNKFLQIIFTIVYAMNQNGWLALIICTEKKNL